MHRPQDPETGNPETGPIHPAMFNNQPGHHLKKIVYTVSPGWDGPPGWDQPQNFYTKIFSRPGVIE